MSNQISLQTLPKWIVIWLAIGMTINFWDAWYILLRPASFAGGSLEAIWVLYAFYVTIDPSYLDLNNEFVKSMAFANLIEISIGCSALICNYARRYALAIVLAFSSLLLTGMKTVLIFILETADGFVHVSHNSWLELFFLYFLPNSLWVIFPLLGVVTLGKVLIEALSRHTAL